MHVVKKVEQLQEIAYRAASEDDDDLTSS